MRIRKVPAGVHPDLLHPAYARTAERALKRPPARLPQGSSAGFGRVPTDGTGRYAIHSIYPGRVAGPDGRTQAPHIKGERQKEQASWHLRGNRTSN